MRRVQSEKLRVHIVWIPMLRADKRGAALEGSAEFTDERVLYYWDPDRAVGEAFEKTLGLWRTAWDVYALYKPGTLWQDEAPAPDYWMHQLSMANAQAPKLDVDSLTAAAVDLLERVRE